MSRGPESFIERYRLHVWAAGAAVLIGALFWNATAQNQFLNIAPYDSEPSVAKRP